LNENIPYQAEIVLIFQKTTVKVNNNLRCTFQNPLDILIKEMGFETGITQKSILSKHYAGID
jgi:hypothetical protein